MLQLLLFTRLHRCNRSIIKGYTHVFTRQTSRYCRVSFAISRDTMEILHIEAHLYQNNRLRDERVYIGESEIKTGDNLHSFEVRGTHGRF